MSRIDYGALARAFPGWTLIHGTHAPEFISGAVIALYKPDEPETIRMARSNVLLAVTSGIMNEDDARDAYVGELGGCLDVFTSFLRS